MTLRVVLDSNVVLSALLFSQGRLTWIRHAWVRGDFVVLTSRATSEELIRVLSYPKFRLTPEDIAAVLADYLPFAETIQVGAMMGRVPQTPDPDDQVFLELAVAGKATFLVTGDLAFLAMAPCEEVRVVSPEAFRSVLSG